MSKKIILKGTTEDLKPIVTHLLAMNQMLESKDIGTIYGEPSHEFQARRRFKPQVELFFLEDEQDVVLGYRQVEGQIKFRIFNEEFDTISKAEATALGQKIKAVFGANGGYVWVKGKEMWSYTDWDKGYQLQLLCRSEAGARSLASAVLSIQNHTLEATKFQLTKNQDELTKYPYTPPTKTIMGESVRMPRYRPNVEVRFKYAALHVYGLPNPILLYYRGNTSRQVLVA